MKHLAINNPTFENFYKEFDRAMKTKEYSRGLASSYANHLREFLFFIENKGLTTIHQVEPTDIIAFHEYLCTRPKFRKEGGLSDATIKGILFALRLFFDYLLDIGELDSSPARLPKFSITKHKERNILTVEEIKLVYSACQNKKERALISLAYGCGLRRNEIVKLDTSDILLHKGILIVRDSKNHKNRTIPISDGVLRDLKEYMIFERASYFEINQIANPSLFINNRNIRCSGESLNEKLKEIINRTNNPIIMNKEITLHCLRHSIATHLLDNGATIEFVQSFLGHSSIDTAHLYSKRRRQKMSILAQIR